ncbi:MAG: SBBP repeat-containing protein, partial [Bryobacteraceae bacterium]
MKIGFSFLLLPMAAWGAARLPDVFEENRGQADPSVRYLCRSADHTLFLTAREAVFAGSGGGSQVRFVNASPDMRVNGEEETAGKVNYLIGSDPREWRTNVRTYRSVRYRGLYRGIDLLFYGNEYDFIVAAGADPSAITLDFGYTVPDIQANGDLVLRLPAGSVRHRKPAAYQGHKAVAVNFVRKSGGCIGFQVGPYDRRLPLTIDPVLAYSTYVGGAGHDGAFSVAVDRGGNVYLAGIIASPNFPRAIGAVPGRAYAGAADAFVAKLNPDGSALVYATYLGGSDSDAAMAVAVDASGNAYVTGGTNSSDFPVTPGALQARFGGTGGHSLPPFSSPVGDAFVAKLNPTGSSLVYASYLGGTGVDQGYGIAVNSSGEVYIAGTTDSASFPVSQGAFQSRPGESTDVFIAKVHQPGAGLLYSTFLGGSDEDHATALAFDTSGNAYVTGITGSDNFPGTSGAFQSRRRAGASAYVAKLNRAGSALLYSTYLGGDSSTYAFGIAVDARGSAYITGATTSTDFPKTAWSFQSPAGAESQGGDVFLTKLSPSGDSAVYSSVFGGSGADFGAAIAVDNAGNAYVAGRTYSSRPGGDFPTTPNAVQRCGGGSPSAFVTKFNADGSAMEYSSLLGGADGASSAAAITLDTSGGIYLAGSTQARDFPVTSGALQAGFAGGIGGFDADNLIPFGGDAFLSKVDLAAPSPMRVSCVANAASFAPHIVSPGELVT